MRFLHLSQPHRADQCGPQFNMAASCTLHNVAGPGGIDGIARTGKEVSFNLVGSSDRYNGVTLAAGPPTEDIGRVSGALQMHRRSGMFRPIASQRKGRPLDSLFYLSTTPAISRPTSVHSVSNALFLSAILLSVTFQARLITSDHTEPL